MLAAFPAINTVVMLFAQLFAYADAPGGGRMPARRVDRLRRDARRQAADGMWRREAGLRARPARKSNTKRLSQEWLAGLREICNDQVRCPLAHEESRLKKFDSDRDGTWLDDIPRRQRPLD